MSAFEKLKEEIRKAMLAKDALTRDILRLVVSSVQQTGDASDESVYRAIRKLIKGNEEVLAIAFNQDLVTENNVLSALLPTVLSKDEMKSILESNNVDLKTAKNEGQAMGMAMKVLKGQSIDNALVKELVIELRLD